jgi:hypothetical protein
MMALLYITDFELYETISEDFDSLTCLESNFLTVTFSENEQNLVLALPWVLLNFAKEFKIDDVARTWEVSALFAPCLLFLITPTRRPFWQVQTQDSIHISSLLLFFSLPELCCYQKRAWANTCKKLEIMRWLWISTSCYCSARAYTRIRWRMSRNLGGPWTRISLQCIMMFGNSTFQSQLNPQRDPTY